MSNSPRLVIIGLDGAVPSFVFDQFRDDLPNLSRLMADGVYGKLESCIPAITVPAWSCMMSGRDPGELGIYGFRNRIDRSYNFSAIANSNAVKVPRLWDILGELGWKVAVLGVPGTYPPQLVNGALVSCFLTPNTDHQYTYPLSLGEQISTWVGKYLFDVPNFRSDEKGRILRDIYQLCNQSFTLALHLLETYHPDLLMFVEMGVDRIHHALWRHTDEKHPLYIPNSPYANAIYDYYRHVDRCIGQLLSHCNENTAVLVVSDHGAQPLMGGFCLNQWLIETGYLTLKEIPTTPIPLEKANVDWSQTKAWGTGGYYGRIFLNVEGRETEGVISVADYHRERQKLMEKLESLKDPWGNSLGVKAYIPQEIYQRVRGIPPDLIVYFQDLAWRSQGTVGGDSLYRWENDTGADDANHARSGIIIFNDPNTVQGGQSIEQAEIYDVLPTLLSHYGVTIPAGLRGKVLSIADNSLIKR